MLKAYDIINSNRLLRKKIDRIILSTTSFSHTLRRHIPITLRRIKTTHIIIYAIALLILFLIFFGNKDGFPHASISSADIREVQNISKIKESRNKRSSSTQQPPQRLQLSPGRGASRKAITKFDARWQDGGHATDSQDGVYVVAGQDGVRAALRRNDFRKAVGQNGVPAAVRQHGFREEAEQNDVRTAERQFAPSVTADDGADLGLAVINPHEYQVIIDSDRVCPEGSHVSVLIAVSSSPLHFRARVAIRNTWGAVTALAPVGARLVFLLARPPGDRDGRTQRQIEDESRTFGDIVQENFTDAYLNLTLKTVMGLRWAAQRCPHLGYYMKTDDDIFVNVPRLLAFLTKTSFLRSSFVAGCIKQQKAFLPVNAPTYFPLPPAHPLFVAGAGYVLTGDLVHPLYLASLVTPSIPVEDVYVTGHLAGVLGVHPPLHHGGFTCGELLLDDCDAMQMFTGHRITPERMMHIWEKINPRDYNTSPCFDFR